MVSQVPQPVRSGGQEHQGRGADVGKAPKDESEDEAADDEHGPPEEGAGPILKTAYRIGVRSTTNMTNVPNPGAFSAGGSRAEDKGMGMAAPVTRGRGMRKARRPSGSGL